MSEPSSTLEATQALNDLRLSIDSDRNGTASPGPDSRSKANGINGHVEDDSDPIAKLQRDLERARQEKDALAAQYRNLVSKVTTMRTTLGNKLKEDAEELDRREQTIQQLSAQNDDLSSTVETLKEELIASHEEAERSASELDALRNRAFQESAQENLQRERELRETQTELERCRMERDDWERLAMQEKALSEEMRSTVDVLRRDMDLAKEAEERQAAELEAEKEKSGNLQSVLQDFQSAKEHELRQAVKERDAQLLQVTQSLAEFKHRALNAELQLEENQSTTSRTQELEKEVKEKTLLIGKLRHEAVIINEHLMEALRRLRRNSTDTNVDRRLVTNVLLSFLTTPRADPKRFEILSLLATVLQWSDSEREKAGLQRQGTAGPSSSTLTSGGTSPSSSFWRSRSPSAVGTPTKSAELKGGSEDTESFSRLWVEFLLTEAASGSGEPPPPPLPSTPRSLGKNSSLPGSPTFPPGSMRRLSSHHTPSGSETGGAARSSPSLLFSQHPPPS